MKYCSKCHIEVMGPVEFCPLCQHELQLKDKHTEDIYPKVEKRNTDSHMVLKVFGFICMSISILTIFFNIILPSHTLWSLIVIVSIGSVWLSLAVTLKRRKNILKYLWYQMVIISILVMVLDVLTGKKGWSISFVIPIMLTAAMIGMYLLSKLLHLQVGDYMIYLLFDALFGIIPLIFLRADNLITDIPSLICILTSIISVVGLFIFEGKNMMSELKRRLHI